MSRVALTRWAVVLLLSFTGCHVVRSGNPTPLQPVPTSQVKRVGNCRMPNESSEMNPAPVCRDSLDIVAMGVDGFLIVPWRDSTQLVMTPPSYTNPTLPWMLFGNWLFGSHANTARIDRRLRDLPAASIDRLRRVRAVLVGHGHYDHLMDLPYLARHLPNATVFGSSTVVNILQPVREFHGRRVAVNDSAGTSEARPGTFRVGNTIRARAIAWAHAPNYGNHVIARGEVNTPRSTLPRGVFDWKLGRVYAYTIDIAGSGAAGDSVGARIFFHDAGAPPEVVRQAADVINALPPARSTTVIITAANFDQSPEYPELLLNLLKPQHVLLGHWEDFFRSPEKSERVVRGIHARQLVDVVRRAQGDHWTAMRAGATLRLRY